jgi:hypothetical protein
MVCDIYRWIDSSVISSEEREYRDALRFIIRKFVSMILLSRQFSF